MSAMQKILIVDDKEENLFALEKILSGTGAVVIKARNGNEALIASLNHEFALALLDVQMPNMDGYELAEYLRTGERTSRLPIIFLSAVHSDDQHIFKGYEAGAVDFITKPFEPRILLGKVNVFLELDRQKIKGREYLLRVETLVRVSTEVLSQKTVEGLLEHVVAAAHELTGASFGASGYGCEAERFRVEAVSRAHGLTQSASKDVVRVAKARVCLELVENGRPIKFNREEIKAHSLWESPEEDTLPREVLVTPLLDAQGRANGIIMVFEKAEGNFTEEDEALLTQLANLASLALQHMEASAEAERNARELDAAIFSIADGVMIFGTDGNLIRINPVAEYLLNYKPREDCGSLKERVSAMGIRTLDGTTPPLEEQPIMKAFRGETVVGQPLLSRGGKSGKARSISFSAAPIKTPDGKMLGVAATFTDITEQRNLTEKLRSAMDKLDQRVRERTAELERANEQLRIEVKERMRVEEDLRAYTAQLESLNQELEEFAFVASHDLKEPLRKIRTFGNRLELDCGDSIGDTGKDYLGRMSKAAERMSSLLDALLRYSRVTRTPSVFLPTDLARVVRESISDLELLIEKTGGMVQVETLPTVFVDPVQMRQLFQNLIANALKYRRDSVVPVIRIYSEKTENLCRIHVEDNGIGFEEAYLDRIFKPFQRLHDNHKYEGTGMGLAICRKIVQRHNGIITAQSAPGKGSTFIVSLPLRHIEREGI